MKRKILFVTFLFIANLSFSHELGIVAGTFEKAKAILRQEYPDKNFFCYEYENDSVLEIQVSDNNRLVYLFNNNFCYYEEFRTSNLNYNLDSIYTIFSYYCYFDKNKKIFYNIGKYLFYIKIIKTERYIHIIKTVKKMELNDKQMMDERNNIVSELFGQGENVRKKIKNYSDEEKKLTIKIVEKHIKFYSKIANEYSDKISMRIQLAKLRIEEIYPQLIILLKS